MSITVAKTAKMSVIAYLMSVTSPCDFFARAMLLLSSTHSFHKQILHPVQTLILFMNLTKEFATHKGGSFLNMKAEHKPNYNLLKFTIVLLVVAIVVGIVFTWLRKGEELSPPMTEHVFDKGEATWSIDGYPAKVLHNNLFKIELTDLSGAPLQGAELSVKLEMMDMVCGDYEFKMTEADPGTYTGEGVPLMAGTWKATLTLKTVDQTYTIDRLLRAVH